jgi:hypothetical protein
MLTRRQILISALAALGGGAALTGKASASANKKISTQTDKSGTGRSTGGRHRYTPVVTPNGSTLPYKMKNGVKEFHLIAERYESQMLGV